jgi:DNA polymerase-3 subunit epsilon
MSWHEGPLFAWDTETTGIDVENDRIVTASAVWIRGVQVEHREWLANPGIEIPQAAIDVHGVTNEVARRDGADPALVAAELWESISDAWRTGRVVIGYNLAFDFTILDRELRRHGAGAVSIDGPVIDGFVIDKALDPYRKGKRTLTACCEHYQVSLTDAHSATGDALAAARLAWRLAQTYADQLADLAAVNATQAAWRAAWAADFEDYLRRQGKHEHIDGHWPIRPYTTEPMEASA